MALSTFIESRVVGDHTPHGRDTLGVKKHRAGNRVLQVVGTAISLRDNRVYRFQAPTLAEFIYLTASLEVWAAVFHSHPPWSQAQAWEVANRAKATVLTGEYSFAWLASISQPECGRWNFLVDLVFKLQDDPTLRMLVSPRSKFDPCLSG